MGADEFYVHCYQTGDASPGGTIQIKFIGKPETTPLGFWLSLDFVDEPMVSQWGDWFLAFPWWGPIDLGAIPSPDGVYVYPATLPPTPTDPYELYLQALIGDTLSNLCNMMVK
jgi:hypothetical protein